MSYRPLIAISFFFFCLSILNPVHTLPWAGFFSEFLCFVASVLLLPCLFRYKTKIPKNIIPILFITLIPIVQFIFGQIYFFSTAFFSAVYLFYFCLMIIVGFNFALNEKEILNIEYFLAFFFLVVNIISSVFAIIQWLGLSSNSIFIMNFTGNRPYANMAQPNHLATFLCIGIFSSWYLFEKNKLNKYVATLSCLFFLFTIALTQARVAWIILIFSLVYIFFNIKKYEFKLSNKFLYFIVIFFIICVLILPYINNFLLSSFDLIETSTIVERASEKNGRLIIWNQMLHAIMEKPWIGYGWNQTTAAQYSVISQIHGQEWVTSAHNLVLDIIVWCGIPLGIIIVGYFLYLYMKLICSVTNIEGVFCILAISAITIHSLLEFPMYYSYFFIPIGLLIGVLLKKEDQNYIKIKPYALIVVFVFSLGGMIGIFQQYMKIEDNLFAGKLHAMGDLRAEVELPYHLYFFDFFDARARWLAQYPKMEVNQQKLIDAHHMVQVYLKPYDLYKYAQLLAFNGKKKEAEQQLEILYILYNMKISYASLFEEKPTKLVLKVNRI